MPDPRPTGSLPIPARQQRQAPPCPSCRPAAAARAALPQPRGRAGRNPAAAGRRPMPNAAITRLTLARSRPCAASSEAAPRVGPTHGLQIAPSRMPSRNCPGRPVSVRPSRQPVAAIGDAADRKGEPVLQAGAQQHQAEHPQQPRRDVAQRVAIKADLEANGGDEQPHRDERQHQPGRERHRPEAMRRHRRAEHQRQQRQHAGRQDGEQPGQESEADAAHHSRESLQLLVLATRSLIAVGSVSPVARAASLSPWKAISVLCMRTPNSFTTSFCVSKLTSNTLSASKLGFL